MSKVFNMVGGGGKNISSIVITGLESTDTVTCTKDGKSFTATWDDTARHWEIVGLPLGTFTVTATNGTKTTTETVLIDIAGVYEIEMGYKLWLYKDSDECTDITGGWISSGNAEKNDTYVNLKPISGSESAITTVNEISLSGYTKLFVDGHGLREDYPDGTNIKLIIGSTIVGEKFTYKEGRHTDSFDISFEGSYKLFLSSANGRTGYIYKIWLE